MEPIIKLSHVGKTFIDARERLTAVKDVSLEILPGEFFVFVGPSGSGKSTILRIMSGLEKDFEGSLAYGEGITQANMSFVFQQFALLPWLTVKENVALPLIPRRLPPHVKNHNVSDELKRLHLEAAGHLHPRELSGGMRQRVGLARALVVNPKIMFMDEPFSELDSFTAEELRTELLQIWAERKMTIVMVTHIIEEALELADRVAVLTARPGMLEKVVTNTLPRPRQKRSEPFYHLEDELYRLIKP